jgi:hypothetical protein
MRAAASLGLLADPRELDRWQAPPSPAELALVAQLRTAHADRVAVANASGYHSDVASALDWLRRLHKTMPSRTRFVRNESPADDQYNTPSGVHRDATLFLCVQRAGVPLLAARARLDARVFEGTPSKGEYYFRWQDVETHMKRSDLTNVPVWEINKRPALRRNAAKPDNLNRLLTSQPEAGQSEHTIDYPETGQSEHTIDQPR